MRKRKNSILGDKFRLVNLNFEKSTILFWSITYMLIYLAFAFVDYYAAPVSYHTFWIIRLAVLPFFLLAILSSYLTVHIRFGLFLNGVMVFMVPFSIIIMIAIAKPTEWAMSNYFAGIVLSVFPIGFILMSVRHAFIIVFFILLCYFGIVGFSPNVDPNDVNFALSSGFVLAATVATMLSTYLLEFNQKKMIEQTVEMNKLVQLKDKFISILAHDLRAPCGNIIGLTQLYMEYPGSFKDDETKVMISGVNDSATRLLALLQNLLEWSHLQSVNNEVRPVIISFKDVVKENIDLVENLAKLKNILLTQSRFELGVSVLADLNMIETVIRNLLSNAIKFTPEGGTIDVSYRSHNEYLYVSISDNGIGVSPERAKTLFQIVKSKSTVGTNNESGSGLGLILCQEMVKKNKGDIWVESEIGKGTKFTFTVPLYLGDNSNKEPSCNEYV